MSDLTDMQLAILRATDRQRGRAVLPMIGQGESELNVSPDVEWREVEDGTGRTTYRHVIYTEWQVLPGD